MKKACGSQLVFQWLEDRRFPSLPTLIQIETDLNSRGIKVAGLRKGNRILENCTFCGTTTAPVTSTGGDELPDDDVGNDNSDDLLFSFP